MGYNDSYSEPTTCGINKDRKEVYFVSGMQSNLTLLCANAYCQDGCAVLYADDGIVLRMSTEELQDFREFLFQYPIVKKLKVNNRTYEVNDKQLVGGRDDVGVIVDESAYQGNAVKFFSTKINVSNRTERVVTLLMTGLSFRDWHAHVKMGV